MTDLMDELINQRIQAVIRLTDNLVCEYLGISSEDRPEDLLERGITATVIEKARAKVDKLIQPYLQEYHV